MTVDQEWDIIRPLGLVTLHFGYAEYELDSLLERLALAGFGDSQPQRPIGQKLRSLTKSIRALAPGIQQALDALISDVEVLLARGNALIHGCILGTEEGRRVTKVGMPDTPISRADLTSLAERIYAWKEHLWAFRWKQVEPLLPPLPPEQSSE